MYRILFALALFALVGCNRESECGPNSRSCKDDCKCREECPCRKSK